MAVSVSNARTILDVMNRKAEGMSAIDEPD